MFSQIYVFTDLLFEELTNEIFRSLIFSFLLVSSLYFPKTRVPFIKCHVIKEGLLSIFSVINGIDSLSSYTDSILSTTNCSITHTVDPTLTFY